MQPYLKQYEIFLNFVIHCDGKFDSMEIRSLDVHPFNHCQRWVRYVVTRAMGASLAVRPVMSADLDFMVFVFPQGSPLFGIRQRLISSEEAEGTIYLLGPLDYEKQATYHLTVLATVSTELRFRVFEFSVIY